MEVDVWMCFKTDADDDRAQAYCLALLDHSAILAELIRREAELVDYCSEGSDDDGEEDANSARTSFYQRRAQEALVLYAPMAHTMRVGKSFWQYEDAALKLLVPSSYAGLEKVGETREREREREGHAKSAKLPALACVCVWQWLRARWLAGDKVLEMTRERIVREIDDVIATSDSAETLEYRVIGRTKSILSTMKKLLLRHGTRRKETIHDLLGLRIIVKADDEQAAIACCYKYGGLALGKCQH